MLLLRKDLSPRINMNEGRSEKVQIRSLYKRNEDENINSQVIWRSCVYISQHSPIVYAEQTDREHKK